MCARWFMHAYQWQLNRISYKRSFLEMSMRACKRRRVDSAAGTCPCFESVDTNHHLGMVRAHPDLYTSSTELAFSMRLAPDAPRRRFDLKIYFVHESDNVFIPCA